MEVILREHVEHLGRRGDVVKVTPGYARNYLLPRKLALAVTENNKRQIEREKKLAEARDMEEKSAAEAVAARLGALDIEIARRVGENDALYGSVTSADIAQALKDKGFEDRQAQDQPGRSDQGAGRDHRSREDPSRRNRPGAGQGGSAGRQVSPVRSSRGTSHSTQRARRSVRRSDADRRRRHSVPPQHPRQRQRLRQARASRDVTAGPVDGVHPFADVEWRERAPCGLGSRGAQHPAHAGHTQSGGRDAHRERRGDDETPLVPAERAPSVKCPHRRYLTPRYL